MNKAAFFNILRHKLFAGQLTQGVVDTVNEILNECYRQNIRDYREKAYILATAYHEAYSIKYNPDWLPIREGFTASDAQARAHVAQLFKDGIIQKNYAIPNKANLSYYGRGWPQITHEENYKNLSRILGIDLWANPDLALQRPIAAVLLVRGMRDGWYTGKKLKHYITDQSTDFKGARKIINGEDKAQLIANYAMTFYQAIIQL